MRIRTGDAVELERNNGTREFYRIVNATYAGAHRLNSELTYFISPENGIISNQSRLGQSLIGKETGDKVLGFTIVKIHKTASIPNMTDIIEEHLKPEQTNYNKASLDLSSGKWLSTRIVYMEHYLAPELRDEVIINQHQDERCGLISGITITNIEAVWTGKMHVILESINCSNMFIFALLDNSSVHKLIESEEGDYYLSKAYAEQKNGDSPSLKIVDPDVRINPNTHHIEIRPNQLGNRSLLSMTDFNINSIP